MNILHKLRQALINAGWIRGVEVKPEAVARTWRQNSVSFPKAVPVRWEEAAFYRDTKALQLLDHRIQNVREMILKAKAQKKAHKKHEAKLKELFQRRAELTGTK